MNESLLFKYGNFVSLQLLYAKAVCKYKSVTDFILAKQIAYNLYNKYYTFVDKKYLSYITMKKKEKLTTKIRIKRRLDSRQGPF